MRTGACGSSQDFWKACLVITRQVYSQLQAGAEYVVMRWAGRLETGHLARWNCWQSSWRHRWHAQSMQVFPTTVSLTALTVAGHWTCVKVPTQPAASRGSQASVVLQHPSFVSFLPTQPFSPLPLRRVTNALHDAPLLLTLQLGRFNLPLRAKKVGIQRGMYNVRASGGCEHGYTQCAAGAQHGIGCRQITAIS